LKEKKGKKMSVRNLYKVQRENKKDEKFAPQAQAILDAIKTHGEPIDRLSLVDKLDKTGVLNSKQGGARVFSFFRPKLIAAGVLREIKEQIADDEKPAKAAASEKKTRVRSATASGGRGKKTEQV
jgi:hypothetical protein